MSLLSPIISSLLSLVLSPLSRPRSHTGGRVILKVSAFMFLVGGYVLGCIVLYNYLTPFLGEIFSLLSLCGVLLLTSLSLFVIEWSLRPRHNTFTTSVSPLVEKTFNQITDTKEINKMLHDISPVAPIVAGVIATGVLAYFIGKKRETL